ncbi:MAG TPA: tetratricopeptide repeat protein [Planctomycetota bacterium]|nr:tetratricopeptide repeat protein [Planctomycetota bacterium]
MEADPPDTEPPDPVDAGLEIAFGAPGAPPAPTRAFHERPHPGVSLDAAVGPEVEATRDSNLPQDPTGRYRVLREIGRGGVGVVYRSRDVDLGRDVAMKVLREEHVGNLDVLDRFVEEAQIGAQLQHPGIVPVYGLGLHDGERPFFAMKLVQGETLAILLRRRADPGQDRRRLLGIFEQTCQTVAYAHARRVVHRDLKPANVMIGAFGEVQVVDWGFAKVMPREGSAEHELRSLTARTVIETLRSDPHKGTHSTTGTVMGTPAYMSPEQAMGAVEVMDQRTDVFALGAILCEILTGQPPYVANHDDVLSLAARGALQDAWQRLDACRADGPLVDLAMQCLAPSRQARPADASTVAERIGSYLTSVEDRTHAAELRAVTARYRMRSLALIAATVVVLIAVGTGVYLWGEHESQARRAKASRLVSAAATSANVLLGQARAGDGIELWDRALADAERAVALALDADVAADLHQDAEALLEQVRRGRTAALSAWQRRRRDADMHERLITLRMPVADNVRAAGWEQADAERMDREYRAAFAAFLGGTDFEAQPTEASVAQMRDSSMAIELAAALDHWAMVRDGLAPAQGAVDTTALRLRRAAWSTDESDDPWRTRLRTWLLQPVRAREALEPLAADVDLASQPAVVAVLLGEALWRAGARERAIAVYRRAQELHAQDFGICFRLAVLLELRESPDWSEVVAIQRIAHSLRPDRHEVLHRMGMALDRLGRHADALRVFTDLAAGGPERAHWHFHMGYSHNALGEHEQALASYQRCVELQPDDALALANLGGELAALGRYDDAIASCRAALARDDNAAGAHTNLGVALYGKQQFALALASLRRAVQISPDAKDAWLDLARVQVSQGQLADARASYERLVQLAPEDSEVQLGLAEVASRQGDLELALASFARAVELAPDVALHQASLARCLADRPARLDDAESHVRLALQIDPRHPAALRCLCLVLARQDRVAECVAAWGRAAASPGHDDELAGIANELLRRSHADEAVDMLRSLVERTPRSAKAQGMLAAALEAQGDRDGAIEGYRRALALDPEMSVASNNLGALLCEQGNVDEGMHYFEAVLARLPDDLEALANLGDALARRGQLEAALLRCERVVELCHGRDDPVAKRAGEVASRRIGLLETWIETRDQARAVLRGERAAATAKQWADAVHIGYDEKAFREVARLTERALLADPTWADTEEGALYGACCCAALATTTAAPSDADRAHHRELALLWLRTEAARWTSWTADARRAELGRQRLRHALQDPDFAAVRGDALDVLPAADRAAWRDLWRQIEAAVKPAR